MTTPTTLTLAASARTTQGNRELNEDRVVADLARGIFAVVDGAGGPGKGDVAADLVAECARMALPPAEVLQTAHMRLGALTGIGEPGGMAASALVVRVADGHVTLGRVGGVNAFLVRNEAVQSLTDGLSDVAARLGRPGEAPLSMGQLELALEPEDVLILCSNGLTAALAPENLLGSPRKGPALDAWLASLLELAVATGSPDNVSAVVIRALSERFAATPAPAPVTPVAVQGLAAIAAGEPGYAALDLEALMAVLEDERPERVVATRLEPVLTAVCTATGAREGCLLAVDAEGKQLLAAVGDPPPAALPDSWAALVDSALASGGVSRDRQVSVMALPQPPGSPSGRSRIVLCLAPPPPSILPAAVAHLTARAESIGVLARVLALRDESRRHLKRFSVLNHVSKVVASSVNVDRVLHMLLEQTLALTGAMQAYVILPNAKGELISRYGLDWTGKPLEGLQISRTLTHKVLETRQPLCIMDTNAEESSRTNSMVALDIQSVMCVPLIANDRAIGCLYVSTRAIAKPFTLTDLEFLNAIANQTALSVQHALYFSELEEKKRMEAELMRIGQEMTIARRIQSSLLPRDLTVEGFELGMALVPAKEVGGDLIDFLPMADGRFWLAIGDATGHGLTAGLVMMMAASVLAGLTTMAPDASPANLLALVNDVHRRNVVERLRNDTFMTLQLLRHDGYGRFITAGLHCDMLIYRAESGTVERLETSGFWTGFLPDVRGLMSETTFELGGGDVLLLYTDGLIEARDKAGEQYDLARLEASLVRHGREPAEKIKTLLLHDVAQFLDRQDDDISLIVLKRLPLEPA